MPSQRDSIILEELEIWREEGVIDEATYHRLRQRYKTQRADLGALIKWVLIFGAIVLGGGITLLFSDVFKNLPDLIIVLMLTAVTGAFYYAGFRLSARRRRTLVYSGRALVFVGTVTTVVDLVWLSRTLGLGGHHWPLLVAIAAIVYFLVGYLMHDLLVLVFGIIASAIWFGAETGYLSGWDTYWLGMNYPIRFAFFGALLIAIGWLYGERAKQNDSDMSEIYGRIYLSIGLFLVLGSLWLTSLVGNTHDPDQFRSELALTRLLFILGFTIASALATIYGVRQADKMVLGYGAVFLCIDVYTRFFEQFWNTLSKSIFFISLGTLSLVVGIFLEFSRRNKLADKLIERQTVRENAQSD